MGLELQLELQANATLREQGGPAFYILVVVDCVLLLIFCVEYILRARVLKRRYLCSFSGLLDLVLVLSAFGYISVIQLSALQPDDTMKGVVRAVRLLRILRVVHLLQIMPALALLVKGLVSTIITIMDAMILLAIISYIGWKRIHETSKLDTEGQSLITSCVLRNCHGYDWKKSFTLTLKTCFFFIFQKWWRKTIQQTCCFFDHPSEIMFQLVFLSIPTIKRFDLEPLPTTTLNLGPVSSTPEVPWFAPRCLGERTGPRNDFFQPSREVVLFGKHRSAGLCRCLTSESFPLKSDRRALEKRKGWWFQAAFFRTKFQGLLLLIFGGVTGFASRIYMGHKDFPHFLRWEIPKIDPSVATVTRTGIT